MERKFYLIGVFWFVLLIALVGYAAYPTLTGKEILLQLAPVDPTDIFAGEYMTLRYQIASYDHTVPTDAALVPGETIYVLLSDGDVQKVIGYVHKKPSKSSGSTFIKGTVQGYDNIDYNIERYYIPEGSGNIRITNDYYARVKVDSNGNARIMELVFEGKPVDFRYQNNYS